MRRREVLYWAGVVLLGGATFTVVSYWTDGGDVTAPTPPRAATAAAPTETTAPTPMTAALDASAPEPAAGVPTNPRGIGRFGTPPPGSAVFPDGTWLPPLNGVTEAPPYPEDGTQRPFSPIVRIYRNPQSGQEWYVHADGSYSTTWMAETTEPGRHYRTPMWEVAHQVPTLPVR